MAAGTYNLTGSNAIERGACYSYSIDLSTTTGEYTLSGYAVSGYLRRKWDGSFGPDWTTSILSTGSGIITLSLDAAKTSELSYDSYEQDQIDLTVNQFGDVPPHATTHAPNGSDSLGAYYITGDVVRPSETGSFITTGQTGQFATTGQLSFSNTEVITGDTTLAANKSYLVRIPPGTPSSALDVYLPSNPQSGSFIELQTEFLESGWGFAKGLNINANGNLATGWQNEISWTGDFSIFAPLQAPLFADLVYNGSAWIYTYKGPDLSFGRIYYAGPGALLTVGSNYRISSVNSGIFAAAVKLDSLLQLVKQVGL